MLRDSISDVREIAAGKTIIRAGVLLNECTLLCEGFICRYKDLADGQRQIQGTTRSRRLPRSAQLPVEAART